MFIELNQDEVCSLRTRKTQNIKINMTCGSDFRLKKLYLFLHIFLTFSRENSRLGTSPQWWKSGPHCVMGRSQFWEGLQNLVKWINGKSERNFKNKTLRKIILHVNIYRPIYTTRLVVYDCWHRSKRLLTPLFLFISLWRSLNFDIFTRIYSSTYAKIRIVCD
jgi:hypothetical protein